MIYQQIRSQLKSPYPYDLSLKKRFLEALVFASFVFLFLFIFQPFQIGSFKEHTWTVSLGYGLVCFLIMVLLNLAIPMIFKNYFDENRWTTGRQIGWTLVNVLLIGFGNFIFSNMLHIIPFSWEGILQFQFFTFAIGAFPVVISTLINQARLQAQFNKNSAQINANLTRHEEEKIENKNQEIPQITIPSQYAQDDLRLKVNQLLYLKSADNYIVVYYLENQRIQKSMLRNSLKTIENLALHKNLFRCHKSYLVNLDQVEHVSGNAQGYKLHLKNCDDPIPVSRSNNDFLKKYFE